MALRAVAFDVGETLVDETRYWSDWGEWLGVQPFVIHALLGATIALREPHERVFQRARPDLDDARRIRRETGARDEFREADLFADVRPCLRALRKHGLQTCVAGNQPPWVAEAMGEWGLPVDAITGPAELDAAKPDPRFFEGVAARLGVAPGEIAYVGDRADNDVVPAAAAGMVAVFLRRGPWAAIQRTWPEAERATATIDSLDELPGALGV